LGFPLNDAAEQQGNRNWWCPLWRHFDHTPFFVVAYYIYLPLCANMTSSITPDTHVLSVSQGPNHGRVSRTKLVKIGRVVLQICSRTESDTRTDKHTHTHTHTHTHRHDHHNTSLTYRRSINKRIQNACYCMGPLFELLCALNTRRFLTMPSHTAETNFHQHIYKLCTPVCDCVSFCQIC